MTSKQTSNRKRKATKRYLTVKDIKMRETNEMEWASEMYQIVFLIWLRH